MELFEWSEAYSIRDEAIDLQHRELFRIANELYGATRARRGEEAVGGAIRSLLDYAHSHFAAEEELMLLRKCPDLAAHKAVHNALLARVTDYERRYRRGDGAAQGDVLPFLLGWLLEHTLGMDLQHTGAGPRISRDGAGREGR
jgi:hemerythrin